MNEVVSARSLSLATCVSTLNDLTLVNVNPIGLVKIKKFSAGLQYENTVGLPELQKTALIFAQPLMKGGVGIAFQSIGVNAYRVINSSLNYGVKLTSDFFLGVHLGLKNVSIQNYGNRTMLQFSLAFQGRLTKTITYGLTVQSIGREYNDIKGLNSINACLGFKYKPSESLTFYSEVEKSLLFPLRLKCALEYEMLKSFFFRTGIMTSNYQLSGGIGCVIKERYRFDLGTAWQPILGVTMQGGIIFFMNETE